MVRPDTKTDGAPARRLNVVLAREVAAGRMIRVMASPAVGTGVGVDLCDFGFVVAREKDLWLDAETIARTTWKMIENTSIRPMKDGKLHQQEFRSPCLSARGGREIPYREAGSFRDARNLTY